MLPFSILIISLAPVTSAAVHSLQYCYTATSGIPGVQEFIGVGKVDDVEISYYDSVKKVAVPKQDWMKTDDAYWERETQVSRGFEQIFKADLSILQHRFNQTGGLHVFQKMYGCRWDDETGDIGGFEQFGYDGEDFMGLDLDNMRWIAVVQQAIPTTQKWNRMEMAFPYRRDYFHGECVHWLKKYLDYGKRTVYPKVSLLQRGSYIVCHATGFYPKEVRITWQKNGEEIECNVGETLPNEDGTFQRRAVLAVPPEERRKARYSCKVTHKRGMRANEVEQMNSMADGPLTQIHKWDEEVTVQANRNAILFTGMAMGIILILMMMTGLLVIMAIRIKRKNQESTPPSVGLTTSFCTMHYPFKRKRNCSRHALTAL